MRYLAFLSRPFAALFSLLAIFAVLSGGCQTDKTATNTGDADSAAEPVVDPELLRQGDLLKITFKGPTNLQFTEHEERIPASGQITLQYIGKVQAVGKTRVELQDDIRGKYVPVVFKELSVTIAPAERFFYVGGEVEDENRHPYLGELTLREAINAAKGFTEFANKKNIQVTRTNGKVITVNYFKALEVPNKYDIKIQPGDKIVVKRRLF